MFAAQMLALERGRKGSICCPGTLGERLSKRTQIAFLGSSKTAKEPMGAHSCSYRALSGGNDG